MTELKQVETPWMLPIGLTYCSWLNDLSLFKNYLALLALSASYGRFHSIPWNTTFADKADVFYVGMKWKTSDFKVSGRCTEKVIDLDFWCLNNSPEYGSGQIVVFCRKNEVIWEQFKPDFDAKRFQREGVHTLCFRQLGLNHVIAWVSTIIHERSLLRNLVVIFPVANCRLFTNTVYLSMQFVVCHRRKFTATNISVYFITWMILTLVKGNNASRESWNSKRTMIGQEN